MKHLKVWNFDLQIGSLRQGYRTSQFTPEDVALRVIERRDSYPDPAVWISKVPADAILLRARELMKMSDSGLPLYGAPFAVKDNIDVAGMPTSAGCPAFVYTPTESAAVVERLIAAGAMLIGKTNLDQFATGLVGTRSPYGAPGCVFDPRYISGGSSSGSGVAVGAHLVSFALGTDTAGSGRVPASFNNIVGLKPTRGLLSTRGTVPACRSLDCISIFAPSVGDAMEVFQVVAAIDDRDPYSRFATPRLLPLQSPHVGILAKRDREFHGDTELAALYQRSVEQAGALGWRCAEIDYAPFREAAALLYDGPRIGERLADIRGFVHDNATKMDPVVRRIIENAGPSTNVDAFQSEYRLQELRRAVELLWRKIDLILLPTTPTILTKEQIGADPIRLNNLLGTYTNFVNLLDLCAIAVPAGFRRGNDLPFGVTLIAPAFADEAAAVLADQLHRAIEPTFGARRRSLVQESTFLADRMMKTRMVEFAVAGAHLSGMTLNHELTGLGGILIKRCRTAMDYRLFALPRTVPPKPGLVRDPGFAGHGIEVEVWLLTEAAFGAFVKKIISPMAMGNIELDDGTLVCGFVCESHALREAEDISVYGGWRTYQSAVNEL